jgi:hypothetical protein
MKTPVKIGSAFGEIRRQVIFDETGGNLVVEIWNYKCAGERNQSRK